MKPKKKTSNDEKIVSAPLENHYGNYKEIVLWIRPQKMEYLFYLKCIK